MDGQADCALRVRSPPGLAVALAPYAEGRRSGLDGAGIQAAPFSRISRGDPSLGSEWRQEPRTKLWFKGHRSVTARGRARGNGRGTWISIYQCTESVFTPPRKQSPRSLRRLTKFPLGEGGVASGAGGGDDAQSDRAEGGHNIWFRIRVTAAGEGAAELGGALGKRRREASPSEAH